MHFHGDGSSSRRGGIVVNFSFVEGEQKTILEYIPEEVGKRNSAVPRSTTPHHGRCRQAGVPSGQAADIGMRVFNG